MTASEYPQNWRIGQDFDPNQHLMNLKGRDYLNVQNRLLWFIRDQRALIVAGLAQMPYVVRTELVEMDRDGGWAHFKTYVRDVLGNETTMYGSEAAKDFPDFAEKASTKSLGRALLALGYGTAFAPEMDEGERVVDSPTQRRQPQQQPQQAPQRQQQQPSAPEPEPAQNVTWTKQKRDRLILACEMQLGWDRAKTLDEIREYTNRTFPWSDDELDGFEKYVAHLVSEAKKQAKVGASGR